MMLAEHMAEDRAVDLGPALEETRNRFLAAVKEMRPRLHRFCSRMCGSVLDGEDLVQETLAQAFYYLPSLKDQSRLEPWLFRIAHNKCVDFLRRERKQREDTVPYDEERVPESVPDGAEPADQPVDDALAALVAALPPKERACVLLKDVLDYPLAEIAGIVDSTLGGVKAALHRGRAKLRELQHMPSQAQLDGQQRKLLEEYIEHFNRQDWESLRRLIQADARVEIVGITEFSLSDVGAPYFRNYTALPWEWRFSLALVDGEPLIVHWQKAGADWLPRAAVRLWWRDGKVARIRDYVHVGYLLQHARTVEPSLSAPGAG
jgi:RNA polymerase sigma-70 factor (ECF subfamily)